MWHYEGGAPSRRSFCLFWRETKQRPELEIFEWDREMGKGRLSEALEKGTQRRQFTKGDAEVESTTDSRRDQSGWDSPGAVRKTDKMSSQSWADNGQQKEAAREGESGWVGIPSSFVEILLEIHASVSLQIHRECCVTELPFLCFELT